jgi:hypothetical protein
MRGGGASAGTARWLRSAGHPRRGGGGRATPAGARVVER